MGTTKLLLLDSVLFQIINMSLATTQAHREGLQRQTQADWVNREYIELITGSIKRIADFLNSFDMSCRSRLSVLNEKLTYLERKVDLLEARVATGGAVTDQTNQQ